MHTVYQTLCGSHVMHTVTYYGLTEQTNISYYCILMPCCPKLEILSSPALQLNHDTDKPWMYGQTKVQGKVYVMILV